MQMPKSRMIASLLILLLTLPVMSALGQSVCEPLTAQTFAALNEACGDAPLDAVCAASGEVTALDALSTVSETSVILLTSTDENNPVKVYLFGGATVTAYEQGASSSLLEIGNRAGYNVNLRAGAGSNFDVIGIFRYNERLNADGQSADGQWLRVVLEDGQIAWVGTSLVAVDPAIANLPVVDQNTSTAVGHNLTIAAPAEPCTDSSPAALITSNSDTAQTVTINGVRLSIENGAFIVALHGETPHFYALNGSLKLNNQPVDLGAIRAADTLEAPEEIQPFPALETIQALPLEGDLAVCLVQSDADIEAFDTPAATESPITLAADGSYPVVAQTTVDDVQWLQLSEDFGASWINASQLETFGACEALPQPTTSSGNNTAPVTAADAGVPPNQIMLNYLSARVVGDGARMQQLACTAYDGQALLQSQSFLAMRAELQNVVCSTTAESATSATVFCSGHIQTEYNGAFRQWELGAYSLTRENGAWRMCGEAN